MEVKRRPFQGVLNILSFNRHFYVFGLGMLMVLFVSYLLFEWPEKAFWIIVIAFLYGLIMPLIVSAWVYDFSGYYKFQWLNNHIRDGEQVNQIVNINAGFDETSFIITSRFPASDLKVFDFYNAKQHTEPAIIRARKVSLVYPNTQQIASHSIPVEDKTIDVVFLLSAVASMPHVFKRIVKYNFRQMNFFRHWHLLGRKISYPVCWIFFKDLERQSI